MTHEPPALALTLTPGDTAKRQNEQKDAKTFKTTDALLVCILPTLTISEAERREDLQSPEKREPNLSFVLKSS
jgi:hypothetical protein